MALSLPEIFDLEDDDLLQADDYPSRTTQILSSTVKQETQNWYCLRCEYMFPYAELATATDGGQDIKITWVSGPARVHMPSSPHIQPLPALSYQP